MAAYPGVRFPSELTTFYKHEDDLLAELPRVAEGCIELPSGPGMGIVIDEDKLKKYKSA